MTIKKRSCR